MVEKQGNALHLKMLHSTNNSWELKGKKGGKTVNPV